MFTCSLLRLPQKRPYVMRFSLYGSIALLACVCGHAASLHIEYPMLFKVENRRNSRSTHCGVLEFIADEGMVYMPYWVCEAFFQGCCLCCLINVLSQSKAECTAAADHRQVAR